ANPDDYWSGWRARQRAELAALPKPTEPPDDTRSPIDRFLAADWTKAKLSPPDPTDDAAFARRVYLDVIGLLPTPEQLDEFVNDSQTPPVQAAQNLSQVFLASSIKCASCHNSFINHWKLVESYGMASFFAPQNLEMHRCDKPTGKIVSAKFLFEGLGEVPADADLQTRHRAVAQMVTRPKNPRFAKARVNRFWKRLLGRGLVE